VRTGVGTWAVRDGALVVGALFVVNAVGEVLGEDGEVIAGPRLEPGERREDLVERLRPANTTIGVVATNAAMSKQDARRLAGVGHDALDVAIRPAHTLYDGDTVFTLATGVVETEFAEVARLVLPAVTASVRRAVRR
jgi:L-aminopeptidase/D-esterase-like protein